MVQFGRWRSNQFGRRSNYGLVPLVYGDVSLDDVRGGTIVSTETVFFYLARHLPVRHVLLLGEVEGVYDPSGNVIPRITAETLESIEAALGVLPELMSQAAWRRKFETWWRSLKLYPA